MDGLGAHTNIRLALPFTMKGILPDSPVLQVSLQIVSRQKSGPLSPLLPVRPPSQTYLTLGVMLEPYALDVVYISGPCGGGQQTAFRGAPNIFVTPIALELL